MDWINISEPRQDAPPKGNHGAIQSDPNARGHSVRFGS